MRDSVTKSVTAGLVWQPVTWNPVCREYNGHRETVLWGTRWGRETLS